MISIAKSLSSYIKLDSNHAIEFPVPSMNFSDEKIIFAIDITSLYTVIPNN